MAKLANQPTLILLISDLELDNWKPTVTAFHDLISQGHKLISFFIKGDPEQFEDEIFKDLISCGAIFIPVNKIQDLVGLVISEVKKFY